MRREWSPDSRSADLAEKEPRLSRHAGHKLTAADRALRRQLGVQAHQQALPRAVAGAGEGCYGGLIARCKIASG